MSFCAIPKTLGSLGTAGELAAAAAGANSAYNGGLGQSNNVGAMGAAVVAGTATAMQMERSPAFLRGLGMGLAPAAAATQASLSLAALQNATTSADRFSAGLGVLAGVTGTIAGLLPPSPAKVALTAASIAASAAQALVEARQPLEQSILDALDQGTQAFNQFFYNRPGTCDIEKIKKKTQSASTIPSPIILDLDGDGIIRTVGLTSGVNFDHAADGFAERTGWVAPDDGLLVWDRNANGTIDSGRELFGSETLLPNGMKAVNGFEALKAFDANGDGAIDANDPVYAQLRVWVDGNTDGRNAEGELLTLEAAGVQSINLHYTNSSFVDAQGNAHRQVGSYTTTDGQTRAATDVWFTSDVTYSAPTEWVEVPEDIAILPDAQGYGKVRDLHQAMAMDATGELKALVTAFTQATTPEDRDALVTQIIYRWTGVQDVDPASRAATMIYGNAIGDARKLEALEEFMGEEWVGIWCWGTRDPNPHGRAAPVLLAAWDELKALVYGQLMSQSHLSGLFQSIAYHWDAETEAVVGDLSAVAQTLATRIDSERDAGLEDLGDFLYSLKGMGLLNRLDVASFKALMLPLGTDVAQTMDAALKGWVAGGPTEGEDVLRGTEFNDQLDARGGNDRLLGRGGNDTLIGGSGNDVLDGGAGNDLLIGSTDRNSINENGSYRVEHNTTLQVSANGNDTYLFGRGDGQDTVIDGDTTAGNTDTLRFKEGVLPSDVKLIRSGNDLVLVGESRRWRDGECVNDGMWRVAA